jgi:polar amino acid transport system permease protein
MSGPSFFGEWFLILAVAPLSELLSYGNKGYLDELFWGAMATLQISFLGYAFGCFLGLLGAVGKISGGKQTKFILDSYTTVFRAIPELVLIMLLYYAGTDGLNRLLMSFGIEPIQVNQLLAAVFVLGFVQGAYSTEVLRAAIIAVPIGQVEAAKAYGMSSFQQFKRVVLPAMLPYAIPGLANLWLNITKDSALIAVIGSTELANVTRIAAGGSKLYLIFYLLAALIYLAISMVSDQVFAWLERRVRRGQPKLA